jgi:hypothetical protein
MRALALCLAVVTVAACGGGGKNSFKGGDSGADTSAPPGDSMIPGPDSPMMATDAADTGKPPTDTGTGTDTTPPPPKDTGPAPWDGTFKGPLTCSIPGAYSTTNHASSPECGSLRWDIKTGTDSAATGISLTPTLTTIAALTTPANPGPSGGRVSPIETTIWALKDVNLVFARLEDDSDYHLAIQDGSTGTTMITEVPFPGCVSGGPWGCFISRARASVEATIGVSNLMLDMGHDHDLAVSIIGAGFFDTEHGQFDVAPNGVELHAVLAICFGVGCNPTLD